MDFLLVVFLVGVLVAVRVWHGVALGDEHSWVFQGGWVVFVPLGIGNVVSVLECLERVVDSDEQLAVDINEVATLEA